MQEESKYLQLAKKLKALAEQGEGGEKYNAKRQLDRIMRQYGITKEQLEEDERRQVLFTVKKAYRRLFVQVGISVVGNHRYMAGSKKKKTIIVIEVSKLEEAEIRAKFNFYTREYEQQLDLFFTAFVYKNHLLSTDGGDQDIDDMSWEEKIRLRKVAQIMEGISRATYMKQLT